MTDSPPPPKAPLNPWSIWIPIIIAALGLVVCYNWLISLQQKEHERQKAAAAGQPSRPPIMTRLTDDLELVERSGKTVHLAELKGKILVAAWVFTRCSRGCSAVTAQMKKLHDEFADHPEIHFLSFTLDTEDTPEILSKFASNFGITGSERWWFLNGDKTKVRNYMTRQFGFRPVEEIPEKDRLGPDDKYMHDLRIAVVDHQGHVRRLEDLQNQDPATAKFWEEQIRKDLRWLIDHRDGKVQ
ncbi:MAG: SCO family protein [Verrucomicrobiaceae bacterium]|jgi:protein SCO1/2|nr:SCO family protein [Verrucomicrobiaceae bacterium]